MIPAALIPVLGQLAPSVIRAAGKLLGGKADDAAEVVASVVESGGDLTGAVEKLPPEQQVELAKIANEAQALENARQAREMEHTEKLHSEIQQTARAEQQFGNDYVKETRPKLARNSFAAGVSYVFLFEIIQAFGHGAGADPALTALAFGPCFGYLGMRTLDKWKGQAGSVV